MGFPVTENPNLRSCGTRLGLISKPLRNWVSTMNPIPMTVGSPGCRPSAWLDLWPIPVSRTSHPGRLLKVPIRSLKLVSSPQDFQMLPISKSYPDGLTSGPSAVIYVLKEFIHWANFSNFTAVSFSSIQRTTQASVFHPLYTTHNKRLIDLHIWKHPQKCPLSHLF